MNDPIPPPRGESVVSLLASLISFSSKVAPKYDETLLLVTIANVNTKALINNNFLSN